MKIVQLLAALPAGGAERFAVDLSNELSEKNDVYVLTFRDYPNTDFYRPQLSPKVRQVIYRGTFSLLNKVWQLFVVTYYLLKIKPEVIHTHTIGISYAVIYAYLNKKVKVFYTVHNLAAYDTEKGISAKLRRYMFKSRFRAVTISKECEISFLDFYGFNSFATIENGCRDIKTSGKLEDVKREVRSMCPSANTKVYICVARIMEVKNHIMLIDVFNRLAEKGEDVVLLLIGKYDEGSELKMKLDASIRTDRIHFLGTRTNIPDYLACSDYFCLASLWEGLPISILEAGLSGCYPICTPVGGVVDVIKNEHWGILSDEISSDSFINAIAEARCVEKDRDAISALYKSRYTMARCAKDYEAAYKK